jgi:hypothetical protein
MQNNFRTKKKTMISVNTLGPSFEADGQSINQANHPRFRYRIQKTPTLRPVLYNINSVQFIISRVIS